VDLRQAKDFLVEQAARQAAIEGIPLSSLEKRMMYFTEGPDAVEDPVQLNDEFEAQYDMDEYESKTSQLLKHARARLESEDPAQFKTWKESVATLRKEDHYILILLGESSLVSGALRWAAVGKLSVRLLLPLGCLVAMVLALKSRFGPLPRASPYVYFGLFVAVYLPCLWWSRRGSAEPSGRAAKAVAKYLFGKW
jgi:hypothetical protein